MELVLMSCLVAITAVVLVCVIALTWSTIREINQPLRKRESTQDRIPISKPRQDDSQQSPRKAKGVTG